MNDIIATDPLAVPATAEVVYDRWIIPAIKIDWPSVESPMILSAWFQAARRDGGGKLITADERVNYFVRDVWALAATDAEVASAMNGLVSALVKHAKAAGVI